jgi:hypothetical protein
MIVVYSGKCLSLTHIPDHSEIVHAIEWNQTPRTRAQPKVSNTCNKNPITYKNQQKHLWAVFGWPGYALFGVICWIHEYPWIESSFDSVAADDHNSMLPCFHKFVIQKYHPLSMEKLAMAMSYECRAGSFPSSSLCTSELLETVWQLSHTKDDKLVSNFKM